MLARGRPWPRLELAGCARPTLGTRSTYTVLGFAGYAVASVFAAVLAVVWQLSLGERLVALLAPPLAFIAVTTVASAIKGREWIVLFQASCGAVAAVVASGLAIDAPLGRLLDIAVLGIGVFLVFGRIGCFHVACCHGRFARRGVIYGPAHVAVGLWPRCAGRPLVPVQLIESAASLALVIAALAASSSAGRAALVYATGYALARFALELVRGDPVRPAALGVSEAQWWCVATATLCALAAPAWWTLAALGAIATGALWLIARRTARELVQPAHLHELDQLAAAVLADPARARRDSSLGVGLSCHRLADGRLDWILSSRHAAWSVAVAGAIADALWRDAQVIAGATPGVVHAVVAADRVMMAR